MPSQRVLVAVTLVNLAAVASLLARTHRAEASGAPGVLRGSASRSSIRRVECVPRSRSSQRTPRTPCRMGARDRRT